MKTIKKLLPHLSISLVLATLTISIFNAFNPRMGFLQGREALVLIIASCVCSLLTALLCISYNDKN